MNDLQKLKIQLMTEGIAVSEDARRQLTGLGQDKPLTLADYASTSGISLRLGKDIWVNAPIAEYNPNFVKNPVAILESTECGYVVRSGDLEVSAAPAQLPGYYGQKNEWGEPYTVYCHTHTDRARLSPIEGCANACRFCDMPFEYSYRLKSVERLIDAGHKAIADPLLPAKHMLVSGGTPKRSDQGYLHDVYRKVLSEFRDIAVDIMMAPVPGLLAIDELGRLGVNQLSINIELFNIEFARRYMPDKAEIGIEGYLDFIEKAVERLGKGRVRSLLLVGIEPVEDTLAAVEALSERGCEPVLSPFRPSPSTPMRDREPPGLDLLCMVYEKSLEIAQKKDIKLGPRCIPCMHNTLTFPDGSDFYMSY